MYLVEVGIAPDLLQLSILFMNRSEQIRQFINNCGSSFVSIKFIKKDGSIRTIVTNPRDYKEVKGTGNPSTKINIVRVRDSQIAKEKGSGAWRSFDCDRVISVKGNGEILEF